MVLSFSNGGSTRKHFVDFSKKINLKGKIGIFILYYLRSKMIVPFLEFDIFWEKFVYTLAAQIALSQ